MRFSVRHETVYRYSAPVRFAPHRLRLTPRVDAGVLHGHDLDIGPDPLGRDDTLDDYGNRVIDLAFDTPAETLRIESRFVLDTVAPPPLTETAPLLPARPDLDPDLAPWLADPDPDPSVAAFAAAIAATSDGRTDRFLSTLCRTLFERTDRHIRPDGAARSAAETLALGSGACRDLTVLFMAAARAVGLPARFVSGYQARSETPDGRRHLHAWPEVHVAGVGWRGWDPTHGVAVGDGHVALSAAPDQAATMPIDGGFFGDGVTSTLTYRVEIDAS